MTDVFLVTKINYPITFKSFEKISHDCGRQAGHTNYAIPLEWLGKIDNIEYQLRNLIETADLDWELLCIGEESEKQELIKNLKLETVELLLQRFFEEFR